MHYNRSFNQSGILSHFPNYNEKTSLAKVLEDSAYYTNPLPLGLNSIFIATDVRL